MRLALTVGVRRSRVPAGAASAGSRSEIRRRLGMGDLPRKGQGYIGCGAIRNRNRRGCGGRLGRAMVDGFRRRQTIGKFLRSEEHTSELQSLRHLVCRLLLEKKK